MPGIFRTDIIADKARDPHHILMAQLEKSMRPAANDIYRNEFVLDDNGKEHVEVCTHNQKAAHKDIRQGIDVTLRLANKSLVSIQEKLLNWHEDTVTVQVVNSKGQRGTWYSCQANFYLVGYSLDYPKDCSLRSWIIFDTDKLRKTANLPWKRRKSRNDGEVEFEWLYFDEIPSDCLYSRSI